MSTFCTLEYYSLFFFFLKTDSSLFLCMYDCLKRSILHNDLASWTGHCRFSTKTCVTVLSYQQSSSYCSPPTSHNALCLHNRDEGLCVFVLEASIFRAQSGFTFSNIKNSHRNLHGCQPESVISINYSPLARVKVRALNQMVNSQRPVEVQQFNGRC